MSIAWNVETHETLASTQDVVKGMARQGLPEGMAVQALSQTAGKGRHGRVWESNAGNLYLSFLLRPKAAPQSVGQLALLTGLAVGETIQSFMSDPAQLRLKWPNDVLISGRKCAGILLESDVGQGWVVAGIGVNISHAPPDIGAHLKDFASKNFNLTAFREALLVRFDDLYSHWHEEGFGAIRETWLKYAHAAGSPIKVKIGERIEEGSFSGIDEAGSLLMRSKDQALKTITAGEVFI